MSALSRRLPESLHRKLAEVATREGVSIHQLISSAVAEKMSALLTEQYPCAPIDFSDPRGFHVQLIRPVQAAEDLAGELRALLGR